MTKQYHQNKLHLPSESSITSTVTPWRSQNKWVMYLLCFMHQATILCPSFPFLVYPFFSFILHYSSRMVLVLFRMLSGRCMCQWCLSKQPRLTRAGSCTLTILSLGRPTPRGVVDPTKTKPILSKETPQNCQLEINIWFRAKSEASPCTTGTLSGFTHISRCTYMSVLVGLYIRGGKSRGELG
jgi:hypothetical protein